MIKVNRLDLDDFNSKMKIGFCHDFFCKLIASEGPKDMILARHENALAYIDKKTFYAVTKRFK